MKKLFILGIVFAIFVASASAQGPRDRVNRHRIESGFRHGQLNRAEKIHLQRHQVRYKAEKRRALRDGKISPLESRRLHAMKRHNSREIYRLKHNGRRRVI